MPPNPHRTDPNDRPSPLLALGAGLLAALFTVRAGLEVIVHGDLWWGLATGRLIRESGSVPAADPFSFIARGREWVNPEWAAHGFFHLVADTFGESSLLALRLVLVGTIFGLVFRLSRLRSGSALLAWLGTAFGAWVCVPFLDLRPQLFTFVFATVFLIVLHRFRSGERNQLWVLPLVQILWSNTHAGFVLGPVLLAGTTAAETLKRLTPLPGSRLGWDRIRLLGLMTPVVAAATLVNPMAHRIYLAALDMSTVFARDSVWLTVLEWFPPPLFRSEAFSPVQFWYFLLAAGILAAAAGVVSRRTLDINDVGLSLALAVALALPHRRFIPLFTIVTVPLLCTAAAALLTRTPGVPGVLPVLGRRSRRALAAGAWVALVFAVPLQADPVLERYLHPTPTETTAFRINISYRSFPVRAVEFLERVEIPGPLFNRYQWGGYLLYRLPGTRVFIDGRAQQVYAGDDLREYRVIKNAEPGWKQRLDRHEIRSILVDTRAPTGLLAALRREREWVWIYGDEVASLFVRETPDTRPFLTRFRNRELPLPETSMTHIAYADDAWTRGDPDGAIAALNRSVELSPEDVDMAVYLANALLAADRVPEARAAVENARRRFPESPNLAYVAAQISHRSGQPRTAFAQCVEILDIASDYIPALQMMHALDPDRTRVLIERALAASPGDPGRLLAAATLAELEGDRDRALRLIDEAAAAARRTGDSARIARAQIARQRLSGGL